MTPSAARSPVPGSPAPASPGGPGSGPAAPPDSAHGTTTGRADMPGRGWNGLTLAAVLIGAALRAAHCAGRGAFWGDEAALGFNLLVRSFAGLARPLDLWQAAPVGFLWLEKATGVALGMDERLLRLPPLGASIAALAVVAWSSRGLVGPRAGALTTLLLAAAPELIRYAGELKPYSGDVAIAAGLFTLAARAAHRDHPEPRGLRALAAAGVLAPWFSLPAVFVLTGCGGILLGKAVLGRDRRAFFRLAAVAAAWAASFAVEYALCLSAAAREPELARYWASAFVPWPMDSLDDWRWLAAKAVYLFEPVIGLPARHLALGLFVAGAWVLWRRDRALVALMTAVVAATLVASALGKYPFAGRLLLFLMPILTLPIAVALESLFRIGRWPGPTLGSILLVALLAIPVRSATTRLAADLRPDDSRARAATLIRLMNQEYLPGDRVLIGREADWFFRFYARRAGFDPTGVVHLIDRRSTTDGQLQPLKSAPPSRSWIFAGLNMPDPEANRLALDLHPSLHPDFRRDDVTLGVTLRRYEPAR